MSFLSFLHSFPYVTYVRLKLSISVPSFHLIQFYLALIFPFFPLQDETRRVGFSVSLHEELKYAIIRKASEHRRREAAALGITEEQVESLYLTEGQSDRPPICDRTLTRRREMEQMRQEMLTRQERMRSDVNPWLVCPSDFERAHISGQNVSLAQSIFRTATGPKDEEQFGDSDE